MNGLRVVAAFAFVAVAAQAMAAPATSPQAAVQVVQDYYAALNRGDYRAAYGAWGQNGAASGQTFAKFRAGFLQTASVRVVAQAATNADAGMSQRTIDVPVDVYATLRNGKKQHFRGSYTLRRVVPGVGAPASQLSWHLVSAKLVPVAH
jgi:hypothetical protein